jgi:response regulator RpfG family c-di-GMP phosphodiesterase
MSAKAKILFVDDEPRIVNLLKIMFRADYEVFTATSGAEALQILASNRIQLIVSDQRMPEMLGIELLMKAREQSPNTVRILLTGYSDLAAIVGSVNDGEVFRFINKPWDQEEIKRIIADAVNIAIETDGISAPITATTIAPVRLAEKRIVLLLDDSEIDRQWVQMALEKEHEICSAMSVQQALGILEKRDVSVIVCEASIGGASTGAFLNLLKHHYPIVTAVMLTSMADSDMVIKLINQAQISRFLRKPLQPESFKRAVASAVSQNQRFRDDPRMMARHKVALAPETESGSLIASFGKALGALKLRFKWF